jgi:hypothetical protein
MKKLIAKIYLSLLGIAAVTALVLGMLVCPPFRNGVLIIAGLYGAFAMAVWSFSQL